MPVFLEVNSPLVRERAEFGGLVLEPLARRLETWAWRQATRVLPVTGVLAGMVSAAGVLADRITVIPNGIDPNRFPVYENSIARKAALGLADKIVLGFAGFIRSWHGLDRVLDMLAQPGTPSRLHFHVVGDGPTRLELEQQAGRLGIRDRVTFAGLVDRDAVASHVAAFDIALQPKSVAYASPLKLFEYMALGKAIVAPDQPNIREILTDEANALLFDPDRPAAMTAAILRLADDPALRERLGVAARSTISERQLTWRANAKRIIALAQTTTNC